MFQGDTYSNFYKNYPTNAVYFELKPFLILSSMDSETITYVLYGKCYLNNYYLSFNTFVDFKFETSS